MILIYTPFLRGKTFLLVNLETTMKIVQTVSWVGVFCVMIYLGHASVGEKVNIGAIFSLDTINGKVSQIAMQAAVDDINSDPSILGGRTLSLHIHDSNYSGFLSIVGALQFMEMDTVAIIGPQSSSMAHVLSHIANTLHIPLLSFTALDPSLSPIQFPYFFQTAPNDLFQMTALAETVSYFGWTQVIAIFTDDDYGRNGIATLRTKLTDKGCKISYKAVLSTDIKNNQSLVLQELAKVKLMETRVIVVHALATYGLIIMRTAAHLGMINTGYVWIATSWLTGVLDAQLRPDIINITQGVVTFRLHTPNSQRKKAFIARWNQLSKASIGLNVCGLYAYDTIWLTAHAINEFLHRGNHISFSSDPLLTAIGGGTMNLSSLSVFDGGKHLHDLILSTNMTGLAGSIQFDSNRFPIDPSYDVINIVGSQLRRIGYWSNYYGLSVMAPEILRNRHQNHSNSGQRLFSVVWPGGTAEQPRGWVFPPDGRKLRIGLPLRTSFRGFVKQDNVTHEVQGYCIDVFLAALKLLPYPVPYEFIFFGDGKENPNYTELVRQIPDGKFDAAVGDIAIVTDRTNIADFTQPYGDTGLIVVVPIKKMSSSAWAFLRPFTPSMWAAMALSLLIVGVVIWILEHRKNDEFRGPLRTQIRTILWFSFSTLFMVHRENTVSTLGRMVLWIWMFVVLIVQQSYTASLTSFLTVQQLSSSIEGIDSLITSTVPIGFQVGSYAEDYLNMELNIAKSRLKPLKSPEEYKDALDQGRVAAVVDERPYVDAFLAKYCHFAIAGTAFTKRSWGFAFKKDSPLALDMSTALLQLSENGGLENITRSWLRTIKDCKLQISVSESEQLRLENFVGLFLICGIVSLIALILYLCSAMSQFRHHSPQQSETSMDGSSHSSCLRALLPFADKKQELRKRRYKRKSSCISCNGG